MSEILHEGEDYDEEEFETVRNDIHIDSSRLRTNRAIPMQESNAIDYLMMIIWMALITTGVVLTIFTLLSP